MLMYNAYTYIYIYKIIVLTQRVEVLPTSRCELVYGMQLTLTERVEVLFTYRCELV